MTISHSKWQALPELLTLGQIAIIFHGSNTEQNRRRVREMYKKGLMPEACRTGTNVLYFKKSDIYNFFYGDDYEDKKSVSYSDQR